MNTETAFLSLDTFTIPTAYTNTAKTNFIFRNVNLRNIMGQMWEKYDLFSIRCIGVRYNGAVANTGSQAYMIQNNIKGLDWVNCYDEKYGTGQIYMPISSARGSNTSLTSVPTNNGVCFNFRKGSPIVNLEFYLTNLSTNGGTGTPTAITQMPDQVYNFLIQPAENNQNEMGYIGLYTNLLSGVPIIAYPSKIISDSARTYTYNNFDMRTVCSTFWDKYEDFEIVLAGYYQQGYVATVEQQIMPLALSGFNWVNNNTKAGTTESTAQAIVGILKSGISGSDHLSNFDLANSPVQFKKSGDAVNFTFQFRNYDNSAINGGLPTFTGGVPNRIAYLSFFIRPIKPNLNPQKATLCLSSAGLTTTPSNLGVTNADYSNITINNIDIRQACQSFWDKYTKFNIFLTAMYPYSTINDNTERCLNLYCEGLQLDSQIKDDNPQQTSQTWIVGPIYAQSVSVSGNFPITFGNTHSTMFYKTQDKVNLTFYVKELGDLSAPVTSQVLRGTLVFTIVPVEESKINDENPSENPLYKKQELYNRKYYN